MDATGTAASFPWRVLVPMVATRHLQYMLHGFAFNLPMGTIKEIISSIVLAYHVLPLVHGFNVIVLMCIARVEGCDVL